MDVLSNAGICGPQSPLQDGGATVFAIQHFGRAPSYKRKWNRPYLPFIKRHCYVSMSLESSDIASHDALIPNQIASLSVPHSLIQSGLDDHDDY
jgi:hypothetical protein